jgi:hypothetical protein
MSWWDTVKANTIGTVYSAWTGNVDPYTVAQIKQDTAADITQAGQGLSPQQVKAQQDAAARTIDATLNVNEANPNNPDGSLKKSLRVPLLGTLDSLKVLKTLEAVTYTIIALVVIGGVTYLAVKGEQLTREFRR